MEKELAIGFGKWISRNGWVYLPSEDCWVEGDDNTRYTNEAVFGLYLIHEGIEG